MPTWTERIELHDVWHNEEMDFEEKRDEIVRRLRGSHWAESRGPDSELCTAITYLGDADSESTFDFWMAHVYDFADRDRIWINTF